MTKEQQKTAADLIRNAADLLKKVAEVKPAPAGPVINMEKLRGLLSNGK